MKNLIALAILAAATPLAAAPVLYTGFDTGAGNGANPNSDAAAAAFAGALSSSTLHTFETDATGQVNYSSAGLTFALTGYDGDYSGVSVGTDPTYVGGFNTTTGGSKYFAISRDSNSDDVTLNIGFTSPVNGIGFYYTATGTAAGVISVSFNDGTSETFGLASGPSGPGNIGFFGFTTTNLVSSISLIENAVSGSGTRDNFGIDDIRFGTSAASAVPEPAMLGLFGLGAIGLGLSRRRKA